MELISFNDYIKEGHKTPLVVTLGQFDGIHLAHQRLIKETVKQALALNYKSAVITFDPHPSVVLNKTCFTLTSLDEKKSIIEQFGIDYLIYIHFDLDFAKVSKETFVKDYLMKLNVFCCVVGFDYTFGYQSQGRACDIETISQNIIKTIVIDEIKVDDKKLGSSLIRSYLLSGNLKEVKKLLGFNYSFTGKVIKGRGVGTKIGLPTANIAPSLGDLKLKTGVYGVYAICDNVKYLGMMNIGHNPSFNYYEDLSIEISLLDVSIDLYDKILRIECLEYIREETKFDSVDDFLKQIALDKAKIKDLGKN